MINPAAHPRARTLLSGLALAVATLSGLSGCGDDTSADEAARDTTTAASSTASSTATADSTETADSPSITVEDPWVRATVGTDDPTMTAAFMVIDNDTGQEVVLEGASSPVAGTVQLHEMAGVDGAMVMREVEDGIVIRADGGKVLQPGGYHVMLMDLVGELAPGDEVDLTLSFSDGTTLQVIAPVKEFTEEGDHYHSPGTEDHDH